MNDFDPISVRSQTASRPGRGPRAGVSRPPAVALVVAVVAAAASFAAAERVAVERTFPADANVEVDVEGSHLDVTVVGWDRGEVRVRADLDASATIDIDADEDGSSVTIEVDTESTEVPVGRLELHVPHATELSVEAHQLDAELRGLRGEVDVEGLNGRVAIQGTLRELRMELVHGSLEFDGRVEEVRAQVVAGNIKIRGVGREVRVETTAGSIELEGGPVEEARIESGAGSVFFAGSIADSGTFVAENLQGDVRLELPGDTSADFAIETYSGRVDVEAPGIDLDIERETLCDHDEDHDDKHAGDHDRKHKSKHGRNHGNCGGPQSAHFRVGSGAAEVRVETFSGNSHVSIGGN